MQMIFLYFSVHLSIANDTNTFFYVDIIYHADLLNLFTSSTSFSLVFLGFFTQVTMLSANTILSLPFNMLCPLFLFLVLLKLLGSLKYIKC